MRPPEGFGDGIRFVDDDACPSAIADSRDIIGCTITRRPIASKGCSLAHRGKTTDRSQPARGRYRARHDARRHGLVTTWGVANPIERIHGHAIA